MASIALPRTQVRPAGGIMSWLTTVDHKKIGILYLYTTFAFFLVGGLFALLMRTQLAVGDNHFLAPGTYNEIMTLHGTTMIFLWIIPVFSGFGNYFVPLMIGARDMAFPRINALSFWLIPLGGLTMYSGLLTKTGAAAAGWTGYVPLTEKAYAAGIGQDLWILGLHILGISSIMGAINFLVTIQNMRAPGMTWFRLPLFVWAMEITAALTLLASPFLAGVLGMVLMDRQLGTHFFIHGSDPLLYQFIFWFYSHPAVYIMILPAFGIVSEVIPVFSRKPIFGYRAMAFSMAAIGVLGFMVFAHHMFTTGLPRSLMVPPGIPHFLPRMRQLGLGTCVLEGRAWSGRGHIVRVEVSTDGGGSWADAELGRDGGDFAWQSWRYAWDVDQAGEYELCCRATDAANNVQPMTAPWNAHGVCNNQVQRITVVAGEDQVPVQPPADGIP
jgi:hypothetical protein